MFRFAPSRPSFVSSAIGFFLLQSTVSGPLAQGLTRRLTWPDTYVYEMKSVAMIGGGKGVMVGVSGAIARTTDGGSTWSTVTAPKGLGTFHGIAFAGDGSATLLASGMVFRVAGMPPAALGRHARRDVRRASEFFLGAPRVDPEGLRVVDPLGREQAGFGWPHGRAWFVEMTGSHQKH